MRDNFGMGHWGWRPLIVTVFISVWVVGCNIVTSTAPSLSPTPYPDVTLTIRRNSLATRTPEAVATASAAFRQATAALVNLTTEVASPEIEITPLPLRVSVPTCYQTLVDSILCLGRIDNPLNYAVERVALQVQLHGVDGVVFAQQLTGIEQTVIPAQGFAPYQALFDAPWSSYDGALAILQSADAAPNVGEQFILLTVENEEGHFSNGRYTITATLFNPSDNTVQALRVIALLQNAAGQVTGYRVAQLDSELPAGDRQDVRMEIVPQTRDIPEHYLYVEARRGS